MLPHGKNREAGRPLLFVGVTSPQTCMVLTGRLRRLREAGFRVVLCCDEGDLLRETATAEGVEALTVPMRREVALWADLVALGRLTWVLRMLEPELAEFSTPKAGLLGMVAAVLAGVPRRIYVLRGLKLEGVKGWRRAVLLGCERVAAGCAQVVLCNGESLREEALQLGIGNAEKLRVLGRGSGRGVNLERFRPGRAGEREAMRAELGIGAEELVVGFVGRLTGDKGIPELLDAFEMVRERVPGCRLVLVGWFDEAEDRVDEAVKARVAAHAGIWHVGYVKDVERYYRGMDVLALPTHREGFPNVALEAAASGIPVVTTLATGARDAVVDGVTGVLVPVGDAAALAKALGELLAEREIRLEMGEAARRWVEENFAEERVVGKAVELYRKMCWMQEEWAGDEPARG